MFCTVEFGGWIRMGIKSEGGRHSSSLNGNKLMYEPAGKLLHCAYLEHRNFSPNVLLIIKDGSRHSWDEQRSAAPVHYKRKDSSAPASVPSEYRGCLHIPDTSSSPGEQPIDVRHGIQQSLHSNALLFVINVTQIET